MDSKVLIPFQRLTSGASPTGVIFHPQTTSYGYVQVGKVTASEFENPQLALFCKKDVRLHKYL